RAGPVPQPRERGREVDRVRVVDARADAGRVQLRQHRIPAGRSAVGARYPDHVQVPDVLIAFGDHRPYHVQPVEQLVVARGGGARAGGGARRDPLHAASRSSSARSPPACRPSSRLFTPTTSCTYLVRPPWLPSRRTARASSASALTTAPASPYAPRFLPG